MMIDRSILSKIENDVMYIILYDLLIVNPCVRNKNFKVTRRRNFINEIQANIYSSIMLEEICND